MPPTDPLLKGWERQLMCVPAVDYVQVRWTWRQHLAYGNGDVVRSGRTARMKKSVTVGAYMGVMRELLAGVGKDFKGFVGRLVYRVCDRCKDCMQCMDEEPEGRMALGEISNKVFEAESEDGYGGSDGGEEADDEEEEVECDCRHCT